MTTLLVIALSMIGVQLVGGFGWFVNRVFEFNQSKKCFELVTNGEGEFYHKSPHQYKALMARESSDARKAGVVALTSPLAPLLIPLSLLILLGYGIKQGVSRIVPAISYREE